MSTDLIIASAAMVIALVSYTLGVFGEKISGTIKVKHLIFFAGGLVFDTLGTTLMSKIANENGTTGIGMHQVTGGLALFLMACHLIWAIWVYKKGSDNAKEQFNKFSLAVWVLWLVSFILGMLLGMGII